MELATNSSSRMDRESQKILVVTKNSITAELAEYAVNVAVRLDLEIIILFVEEPSTPLSNKEHQERLTQFEAKIMTGEAAKFSALAWNAGVKVTAIVDVCQRESAIARIREQDAEIRFILSDEPADEAAGGSSGQGHRLEVIRPVSFYEDA